MSPWVTVVVGVGQGGSQSCASGLGLWLGLCTFLVRVGGVRLSCGAAAGEAGLEVACCSCAWDGMIMILN